MAQTTRDHLYPMLFTPVLKDYVWGGRNLETRLGRALPDGIIAESWEIAAHEDGTSTVSNGYYAGKTLSEVYQRLGLDLLGRNSTWAHERGKFPLLIKLLDAHDKLSVQVHPDDEYALREEGNELGKTEMWVVLHAESDAAIILGVKQGTTPEKFRAAIETGDLEQYLHKLPIETGDVVCVPARSVHALLDGALIAEIQQNSNTTYRVYDWNRHREGKARPLHIGQALEVINFAQVEPDLAIPELVSSQDGIRRFRLCSNRYFVTERVELPPGSVYEGMCDGSTFEIWGAVSGSVLVNEVKLDSVGFTLLPAAMGAFRVSAIDSAVCLRTYVD